MDTNPGYHVTYLTGPPATGKSTLTGNLEKSDGSIKTFVYSKVLAEHVSKRDGNALSQNRIRELSAQIITPQDISEVDKKLINFVRCNRASCHIVIDSHAVTKERYGFRVTPFSIELLQEVRPTLICMLYTEPSVVMDRIRSNNQGRPTVTAFEAAFHCELQASVALIYGINLGLPVYLLDSSKSADSLTAEVLRLMGVFVEQRALDM